MPRAKKATKAKPRTTRRAVPLKQKRAPKRKTRMVVVQVCDKTTQVCPVDLTECSFENLSQKSKMRRVVKMIAGVYKEKSVERTISSSELLPRDSPVVLYKRKRMPDFKR